MSTDVRLIPSADWSPRVGQIGQVVEGLDDIDQAMRIIVRTPKGSDPHRPEFGADIWRYLDHPVSEAAPNIIREATDAIARWEPRAKLLKVTAAPNGAHVVLKIVWSAKLSDAQTTEVRYALVQPA